MVAYETEEQQVEALKEWWRENGKSVIFGIIVGVGGLFGWQSWQENQLRHAEAGSERYEQLVVALATQSEAVDSLAAEIRGEFGDTPYASLAALRLAKHAYESGDLDAAQSHLRWVLANSAQAALAQVARLRLARLLLDADKFDEALALIPSEKTEFDGLYQELRGDIALAQGKPAEAYKAFTAAMQAGPANRSLLQMKIDDLGIAAQAENS